MVGLRYEMQGKNIAEEIVHDALTQNNTQVPLVSLCVVARNEEHYLPDLLKDIDSQNYPHDYLEIVLVDSMSSDATRSLMERFAHENNNAKRPFFRVVVADNPKRILAGGWNIALDTSMGEIVMRVDAHASIPADFVERNVGVLESGEQVCGGMRPTAIKDPTSWRMTLHAAEESAFGSSAASYRNVPRADYVPSVFHGAYRRQVINDVGHFDERLVRTEDNEFYYRVRQKGYRIRFDPTIYSVQYVRPTFKKMIRQKFGNGYWVGRTLFICSHCFQMHHFVPLVFALAILALIILGFAVSWVPFLVCAVLYALLCVLLSIKTASQVEEHSVTMVFLPFVFFGIHISYGIGTIAGIVSGLVHALLSLFSKAKKEE